MAFPFNVSGKWNTVGKYIKIDRYTFDSILILWPEYLLAVNTCLILATGTSRYESGILDLNSRSKLCLTSKLQQWYQSLFVRCLLVQETFEICRSWHFKSGWQSEPNAAKDGRICCCVCRYSFAVVPAYYRYVYSPHYCYATTFNNSLVLANFLPANINVHEP